MDSKLSANLVSIFLVSSVCLLGYVSMSTFGQTTPTPGMVMIDSTVIIRQGNGVNYSFADDATLSKLEVKASSIELNNWLEIGAETSSGYLTNTLYDYRIICVKWTANSTDPSAVATFTLSGLTLNAIHTVYIDDVHVATMNATAEGTISFSWSLWSSHVFTVVRPTVYEQPEEDSTTPSDRSSPTSDSGSTSLSLTSLSMILLTGASVLIIFILLMRRPRGGRSGRQYS